MATTSDPSRRLSRSHARPLYGAQIRQLTPLTRGFPARFLASEIVLRFGDGSRMRLRGGSEVSVEELALLADGTSRTRLYMGRGELFAKVHRLRTRESRFVVESPLLTVGVRGTAFHMVVRAQGTRVDVTEGQVEVSRRIAVADPDTGTVTMEKQVRLLDAGEWVRTLKGRRELYRDQLPQEEVQMLSRKDVTSSDDEWRTLRRLRTWAPFLSLLPMVLLLYVAFSFLRPFPPPVDIDEINAVARRLDREGRPRRADDSAASAALAQMYLQFGDLEAARRELRSIVETDPNSDYGRWARRVLNEIER